jgi:hypothetical protein
VQTPALLGSLFALRGPSALLLALLVLALVPSCSRRRGDGEEQDTAGAEAVAVALAPRELVGVLALDPEQLHRVRTLSDVEALCVAGSNELCNAIDEDCDGRIDEGGCPYRSGDVQITMTWNNGSDIDLFVREPDGDVLSHQRSTSARGGLFDYAGRGQCDSAIEYPRIENVSWLREEAPEGEYQLLLHRWGDCLDRGTETQDAVSVILSISVAGVRLGTFQVELGPQERFEGIRFRISAP